MKPTLLAGLMVIAVAGAANAAQVTVYSGPYQYGGGGEFNASPSAFPFNPVALTNSGLFETFCLELSEHLSFGTTYNVSFGPDAVGGGNGGGSPDPLSNETAYLYYQFITGNLNYNYADAGGTRILDAGALQAAIWQLEDEDLASNVVSGGQLTQALAWISDAQNAVLGGWLNNDKILVMNLFSDDGTNNQSLLVAQVPMPAASAFGLVGLGLVAARRRRA
ncbi:MAG: hypothetical protein JNM07_12005 [Phycisphaerae bacterium]|nr:hypothetical protein [Phycisphaerae bacterium]